MQNLTVLKPLLFVFALALAFAIAERAFAQGKDAGPWLSWDEGLLFAFQTEMDEILAVDASGERVGAQLEPRKLARIDHYGRLLTHGGYFETPGMGANLLPHFKRTNELTLEAFLTPESTQDDELRYIICFGDTDASVNFALAQKAEKLLFHLLTEDSETGSEPNWLEICDLEADVATHVVITYAPGQLRAVKDWSFTRPIFAISGDFSGWVDGEVTFGAGAGGNLDWPGALEGVRLDRRVIPIHEGMNRAKRYTAIIADRPLLGAQKMRGRLIGKSDIPTLEELAPYREALVVFEYVVDKVTEGSYSDEKIYVAHWLILDRKTLPFSQVGLDSQCSLLLEKFEDNPQLASRYLSDTVIEDFSIPLHYDASGLSLGLELGARRSFAARPSDPDADPNIAKSWEPTDAERNQRSEAIQADLVRLRTEVACLGGYAEWSNRLSSFREDIHKTSELKRKTKHPVFEATPGYLFYRMDLQYLLQSSTSPPIAEDPSRLPFAPVYGAVKSLSEKLQQIGVDLIFVPVPCRAEMLPDKLSEHAPHDLPVSPQRTALIEALLEAGVEVLDLAESMREALGMGIEDVYFKDDAHWARFGIRRGAELIAERLGRYTFAKEAKKTAPRYEARETRYTFRSHLAPNLPDTLADRYAQVETVIDAVYESGGERYQADLDAPILMIGDSYSYLFSRQSANVGAHLALNLNMPITELMTEGGGPNVPRILKRYGLNYVTKRRAIIWVMTSRWLIGSRWADQQGVRLTAQ